MTGSENQGEGIADPLVSWESIPGAGGSRPKQDGAETEIAGSAYDQVRGLLAEPGPRVGTGQLSEKMAEEMESFDQRWSQRPVSSLVAAGKKMVDAGDSTGLDRLLGLAAAPESVPDPDREIADETSDVQVADTDCATGRDDDEDTIASSATEAEPTMAPEVDAEVPDQPTHESARPQFDSEASQEDPLTITANPRLAAAQAAYQSLNPLEVEIFLDQAGLLDREQAVHAASRSQRLALETLSGYESRILDLQRELDTERARTDTAAQEGASVNEALTEQVLVLEGRLELAAAEIAALRRGDGDDSEGGAGRQLVKGSDDLRPADADEPQLTEDAHEDTADDATDDDAHTPSEAEVDSQRPDDAIDAEAAEENSDDGGSAMLEALHRLASGEDEPTTQHAFGE